MSAYIVSRSQIDAIVQFAKHHQLLGSEGVTGDPIELGRELWHENTRSVNYRYRRKYRTQTYVVVNRTKPVVSTVEFLKLLRNLDYQSCERPDYKSSLAYKYLRELAFMAATTLDGYDKAPWGLDE